MEASAVDLILELGENTPALRGHQEQRDSDDLGGFEYDLDEDGDEEVASEGSGMEAKLLGEEEGSGEREGGSATRRRRSRRRRGEGEPGPTWPPLVRTLARISVAAAGCMFSGAALAVLGLCIPPALVFTHGRSVWREIESTACCRRLLATGKAGPELARLFSKAARFAMCLAAFVALACASSVAGAVAGALLGLTLPFLVATFGSGAPDHPWDWHGGRCCLRGDVAAERHQNRHLRALLEHGSLSCRWEALRRRDGHGGHHNADHSIFVRFVLPPPGARRKGILVYQHGLHCHGSNTTSSELALFFAERGFVVALPDAVGHGQSDGDFALVTDFEELAEDLCHVCHSCRERFPRLPLFLMGESMGGLLCLLAASSGMLGQELRAVLATCPAFLIHRPRESAADAIVDALPLDYLARILPKLPCDKGVVGVCYPEEAELRQRAVEDESWDGLVHTDWMRLATANTFKRDLLSFTGRERLLRKIRNMEHPLLVQHGGADRCVDIRGSRYLVRTLNRQNFGASLVEYSGKCHCLMTEDEGTKAEYLETSLRFICEFCDSTH